MIKTAEYIDFEQKAVYERWDREEKEKLPFHILLDSIDSDAPRPPSRELNVLGITIDRLHSDKVIIDTRDSVGERCL